MHATFAFRRTYHLVVFLFSVISFSIITYCILLNNADSSNTANIATREPTDTATVGLVDSRIDITSLGISRDFVYMFIRDRSDLAFYKIQKIWEDLILIAEWPEQCQGQERCLALNASFVYKTLHDKVFKTLTLLNSTYKGWNSISKMDDDALVDIRSLRKIHKIQPHTYMGIILTNSYAKKFDITYATGHYYTMGQKAVHCVLEHEAEFYGLNSPAEDATIGWVITHFCEYELVDIKSYNLIWHKILDNNNNKVCNLNAPKKTSGRT